MKGIQKIFVMIFLFLSIAGIIALNTRVILAESISNKEEKKFSEQTLIICFQFYNLNWFKLIVC